MRYKKLTDNEARKLNNESGIFFEGPLPIGSTQCPEPYKALFRKVQDIGSTRFETYEGPGEPPDTFAGDRKKASANQLVRKAFTCRLNRVNESGWIKEIEAEVFHTFGAEVVW